MAAYHFKRYVKVSFKKSAYFGITLATVVNPNYWAVNKLKD